MEVLKFIAVAFSIICIIFFAVVFAIGAVFSIREMIEDSKLRKKWAAEQEQAKRRHNMKLGFCRNCPSRANGIDYFGQPCIYNSEWLCEGPAAPEHPTAITVKRATDLVEIARCKVLLFENKEESSEDWVKVTRCKDCISWEDNYCHVLKKPIYNPDWFCRSGMKKKGDK